MSCCFRTIGWSFRTIDHRYQYYYYSHQIYKSILRHSSSEPFSKRRYSLLFLGAPGVGKGTFGKLIAPNFNAQLMTSSDLLRDAADQSNSSKGKYIKECIATGKLVSDDIVIPIVIDFLRIVSGSFIFDGFPRTLNQAKRLQA
eukprot:772110_1